MKDEAEAIGFGTGEDARRLSFKSPEMILRTPPPKKPRTETKAVEESSPVGSDRQLVIYEDPPAVHDQPSEHLLCTYQCRQMVFFSVYSIFFLAFELRLAS